MHLKMSCLQCDIQMIKLVNDLEMKIILKITVRDWQQLFTLIVKCMQETAERSIQ